MHVSGIRLITVHPALVHVTVGCVPILLAAYVLARRYRSERLSLAGDFALWVATAITGATFAFGLVSNAIAPWPGGLSTWRWLHLGFGCATFASMLALSLWRLWERRRRPVVSAVSVIAMLVITAVVMFTGWIGGEVLVYHAGMAVRAAGDGALAPPVSGGGRPHDVVSAMALLRADWADADTRVASMIVTRPAERDFAAVAADGARIVAVAEWVAAHPDDGGDPPGDPAPARDPMVAMAGELAARARRLDADARARRLEPLAADVGQLAATCADCHLQLRWDH